MPGREYLPSWLNFSTVGGSRRTSVQVRRGSARLTRRMRCERDTAGSACWPCRQGAFPQAVSGTLESDWKHSVVAKFADLFPLPVPPPQLHADDVSTSWLFPRVPRRRCCPRRTGRVRLTLDVIHVAQTGVLRL